MAVVAPANPFPWRLIGGGCAVLLALFLCVAASVASVIVVPKAQAFWTQQAQGQKVSDNGTLTKVEDPKLGPSNPSNPQGGSNSGQATQPVPQGVALNKCDWLRANAPQSADGMQVLLAGKANVPKARIAPHLFPCSGTETVYDGGIILGPAEGWNSSFTVNVSKGGAVDSYLGATFSGSTHKIGSETIRATDGSVTAVRATVWFWLDENPPTASQSTSQPSQPSQSQPVQPSQPTQSTINPSTPIGVDKVASQLGWTVKSGPDKFGGFVIEVQKTSILPPLFEATTSGRKILENDTDRTMTPGTWSVYPPFAWREALGFSK